MGQEFILQYNKEALVESYWNVQSLVQTMTKNNLYLMWLFTDKNGLLFACPQLGSAPTVWTLSIATYI